MENVIKCPHCGYEYLPCEIYMPNYSLGKPETVVKDALGKILYSEYSEEPDMIEHFICEGCGESFVVEAQVSYKSRKETEELSFKDQAVSLLD